MEFLQFLGEVAYGLVAVGLLILSLKAFRIFFQLLPGVDGMNHLEREEMFGRYNPNE